MVMVFYRLFFLFFVYLFNNQLCLGSGTFADVKIVNIIPFRQLVSSKFF